MKVMMMLADAAQVVDNKLYVLGGGWSVTGPQPVPFAIAMKLEVPWDQTNMEHSWTLRLVTDDGEHVSLPGPDGESPVEISGAFEVGRPPGVRAGTPIDLAIAFNSGPLPLPMGRRYVWHLLIDGEHDQDWELGFNTRSVPAAGPSHD